MSFAALIYECCLFFNAQTTEFLLLKLKPFNPEFGKTSSAINFEYTSRKDLAEYKTRCKATRNLAL